MQLANNSKALPGWNELLDLLTNASQDQRLSELLTVLLTNEERRALSQRYRIVAALLEGELSQRTMAETLGVSISQITRGSNQLKRLDPKLAAYLQEYLLA